MAVAVSIPQQKEKPNSAVNPMPSAAGLITAPALFAAVCFACGDVAGKWVWIQPGRLLVGVALLFGLSAVAAWRGVRVAPGTAGVLCILTGCFCAEVQPRPAHVSPLERIAYATLPASPSARRLGVDSGHVVDGSVEGLLPLRRMDSLAPYSDRMREEQSRQLDVRVTAVDGKQLPAPEGLRLTLYGRADAEFPALRCGDRLRGSAAMHTEERFEDPGVWDAEAWLRQQGISALGSAHAESVTVTATEKRAPLRCWVHSLQQTASERLVEYAETPAQGRLPAALRLSQDDAAMLAAMLTGDRTELGRRLRVGFERTGSFHLLVVSGMHLAIFSGLVFWLVRWLRLPRSWAALATIALSFAYALFTGFGQPVQRAFWMVTLYLAGRMLWRERHPLNAIGFAALVMLAVNPLALFDAGLQMTLLSVLAVAGIAVPAAEKSFGPSLRATRNLWLLLLDPGLEFQAAQFRVTLRMMAQALRPLTGSWPALRVFPFIVRLMLLIAELVTTSLAIELMMTVPMAIYFHRITAVALPVNILIVPLLGILLPLGLMMLLLLLCFSRLAVLPAMAVALLLHGTGILVHTFGGMRLGDLRIPAPTGGAVLATILLTAMALVLIRLRRFGVGAAAAALSIGVAVTVFPRPVVHRAGALEISAIDVGQGDSLLVITPNGKTLLIDAGGIVGAGDLSGNALVGHTSNFDVGEDVVSPVLWSRGIRRLDAVAITHAHADHIGGMAAVLANFRPRALWVGINPHSALYDTVLREAGMIGTPVVRHTAGEIFPFDDVHVRVLAPEPNCRPGPVPSNDDSLVLQMRYGRTAALLEGDAEAPSEERMLLEGGLHADFLKVGHHGSRTSTTPAFLAAVSPSWAAISVGRRNFYGHPRHEVLEELQAAQVRTYRTDMVGLSTFYLDGDRVQGTVWNAR